MSKRNLRERPQLSPLALCGLFAVAAPLSLMLPGCPDETESEGAMATSGNPSGSTGDPSGGTGGGTGGAGGAGGAGGGSAFDPTKGWTELPESADTIKIYVSSTDGDDNNDGLSEAKPVKTIAKGKSLVRNTFPDRLLLKRGDVWYEGLGEWTKSGRGPKEPIVVATYGDAIERPLLKTGAVAGVAAYDPANFVAITGVHFYAHTRDPKSPEFNGTSGQEGIRWFTEGESLLIEDVVVQSYKGSNVSINGGVPGGLKDVKIRRSIIVDAYNTNEVEHSQGIYAEDITGLLIEENLLDHNGWHETVPGAVKTQFNHNMYLQVTCEGVTVRRNISTRAASHGLQARTGGLVEENLFIDNPIGFSYGYVLGDKSPVPGGVTGDARRNVVRDAGDIAMESGKYRGLGVQIGNIKSALFEENIVAHDKSAMPFGAAIELQSNNGIGIQGLTFKLNIIYDWRGNFRVDGTTVSSTLIEGNHVQSPEDDTPLVTFLSSAPQGITWKGNTWFTGSAPDKWFDGSLTFEQWVALSKETDGKAEEVSYPDPARTLSKYHESLGKTASFDAYLAEARTQSIKSYRYEYTTLGPINFIRAGFGLAEIPID